MSALPHYTIDGGQAGRERLRLLSRVLREDTLSLLANCGLGPGQAVLDIGCGGGDVSCEMAALVGPTGRVVAVDADTEQIGVARLEAHARGIHHIEFRAGDAAGIVQAAGFDVVYARFLLSHLPAPQQALQAFFEQVRPGGFVAVEDIDFSGHASCPDHWAVRRCASICAGVMQAAGGHPTLGLHLPALVKQAGFVDLSVHVVQQLVLEGEAKRLYAETLRNVTDAVLRLGVAEKAELETVLAALEEYAQRPDTLLGTPRIVQVCARRPA
jgi:2-polyprenyl-3-methyl-5-hydroxy-6-metoxy-1,4-benzoquinol methylase